MTRHLASVQEIIDTVPIEGADRIELAKVLGWQCVVNKNKFKPGDKGVYFEIDSFLPEKPEFEFLRSSSFKNNSILGTGFRLRTQKFRGALSQGLLLPLDEVGLQNDLEIGTDVTEQLGVKKWEIEEFATTGGNVIGTLPHSIPKTDETRIQALPELLDEFGDRSYYISTKMDGSSHSISMDDDGFHATCHNYEYRDDGSSSFYELVKARGFKDRMWKGLTVQGELCAPGIQKNRLKLTKPEWYVFTVMENGQRVGLDRMLEVCKILGAKPVPIEERDTNLKEKYPTVEALLARADGQYSSGNKKEGIVIRPTTPVYCQLICDWLSVKVVSNSYLLKNSD